MATSCRLPNLELQRFNRRLLPALVWAAVVTAALGGKAPAATSGTDPATVRGRFVGIRAPKGVRVDVRAIRVETAEIVTAGNTRKRKRFRLAVPAGPTMLFGHVVDARRNREYDGASEVLRLEPGRRARAVIDARGSTGSSSVAAVTAGRLAVASTAGPRYLGVRSEDVVITGVPGFPLGLSLAVAVITYLGESPCHGNAFQLVEVDHLEEILREIAFSQSLAADPSTRLENRIIAPGYHVQGTGTVAPDGNLALELRVLEAGTGSVIASASASGPAASWNDLLASSTASLACELCTPGACKPAPSDNWSGTITFVSSVDTEVHFADAFTTHDESSHERIEQRWDVSGTGTRSASGGLERWDLDAAWTGSQSIDVSIVTVNLDGCIGNSGYGATTQHDGHSQGAPSGITLSTTYQGTYALSPRVTDIGWMPNSWEFPSSRTYVECTGLSSTYRHDLQVVEQVPIRELTVDPGDPNLLTGTETITFEDPRQGGSAIVTFETTWNLRRIPP